MHAKLPLPVEENLINALHRCRQNKNPLVAKRLHSYMCQHQLDVHPVLGNYLVPALTECGCLNDAQFVFDRLPHRNTYSWTCLISGYICHDNPQNAFCLFDDMLLENVVSPNRCTYLALLDACTKLKDPDRGQRIHTEINKKGLDGHVFSGSSSVGNALVNMYSKCGFLAEAHRVLDTLPVRDVVSWNALIAGYAEKGLSEDVSDCFQQMNLDGLSPDSVTYICSLKACRVKETLETGRQLHNETVKRGMEREPYVGNTLVDMYTKCSSLVEAQQVFDQLQFQNAVSWAALIAGYAEHGSVEKAWDCVQQMQLACISPDFVTFICSLKACTTEKGLETGQQIHGEISKRGIEGELFVGNSLVDMYIKCGSLAEAKWLFDYRSVRTTASWNALLGGYMEHGFDEQVLDIFNQMQQQGVSADIITVAMCLKSCGNIGALDMGQCIHAELKKTGSERNPFLGSVLVDMYGKCGLVAEAREVFDNLSVKDCVCWTAMIKAYGENHEGKMAVQCFEDMQQQGINPDSITFSCLLAACAHDCLVSQGQKYFKLMKEHGIEPTLDHYTCMVNLLARSGWIFEAGRCARAMQSPISSLILTNLLTACKNYGEVELGQLFFQQLVEGNLDDTAAYLLMADIYASIGKWNDANRVCELRKYAGARKKPASASIQVGIKLHKFMVGVYQSDYSSQMLCPLSSSIKHEGYIPNLDSILRHECDNESENSLNSSIQHQGYVPNLDSILRHECDKESVNSITLFARDPLIMLKA